MFFLRVLGTSLQKYGKMWKKSVSAFHSIHIQPTQMVPQMKLGKEGHVRFGLGRVRGLSFPASTSSFTD
jgi:hypothetical protein